MITTFVIFGFVSYRGPYEIMKVGMDIVPQKLHYTKYRQELLFFILHLTQQFYLHQQW